MTNGDSRALLAVAFLVVLGCSARGSDLPELDGGSFVLEVDRVANNPDVQSPFQGLDEADYEKTDQGNRYNVGFSENGEAVTVSDEVVQEETAVMRGRIEVNMGDFRQYGLEEGLFAGGRFNVWIAGDHFEAELTIYGSGRPIIRSERGRLLAAD